ncbi:Plasmodium exported protein, unknown function [Plasmodium gallinaceum]|uniref:Uncharacterized protein n=1 Tax=Plasmodium gallinaceum TaxID=5849 RepID=A0A1J1H1I8_PLAGA|nr:Plasmodium exported protein, unknown function [Plasmodium gallinaceum]CRG97173.1 Plasmodium exported protein, unknown function [Plasmodium gallinaceum]
MISINPLRCKVSIVILIFLIYITMHHEYRSYHNEYLRFPFSKYNQRKLMEMQKENYKYTNTNAIFETDNDYNNFKKKLNNILLILKIGTIIANKMPEYFEIKFDKINNCKNIMNQEEQKQCKSFTLMKHYDLCYQNKEWVMEIVEYSLNYIERLINILNKEL